MNITEQNREGPINPWENLWKTYREIGERRCVDLSELIAKWTTAQIQRLPSPGARNEFEELCNKGGGSQVLAAILALFRLQPRIEELVSAVSGSKQIRRNVSRRLDHAATLIEESLHDFIEIEDLELNARFNGLGYLASSISNSLRTSYVQKSIYIH